MSTDIHDSGIEYFFWLKKSYKKINTPMKVCIDGNKYIYNNCNTNWCCIGKQGAVGVFTKIPCVRIFLRTCAVEMPHAAICQLNI